MIVDTMGVKRSAAAITAGIARVMEGEESGKMMIRYVYFPREGTTNRSASNGYSSEEPIDANSPGANRRSG